MNEAPPPPLARTFDQLTRSMRLSITVVFVLGVVLVVALVIASAILRAGQAENRKDNREVVRENKELLLILVSKQCPAPSPSK